MLLSQSHGRRSIWNRLFPTITIFGKWIERTSYHGLAQGRGFVVGESIGWPRGAHIVEVAIEKFVPSNHRFSDRGQAITPTIE